MPALSLVPIVILPVDETRLFAAIFQVGSPYKPVVAETRRVVLRAIGRTFSWMRGAIGSHLSLTIPYFSQHILC